MPKNYTGLGFAVLYPDSWKMEEDTDSASIWLESPEGAFLTIRRLDAPADQGQAMREAERAMQLEYDDVERETCSRNIADMKLNGITQRFVYLDMIVTSHLLTLAYESGEANRAYLIQMQAEDRDMDRLEIVFEAILTSMCQSLEHSEG